MVELKGPDGEQLKRFSCGMCARGWWEQDGSVIDAAWALAIMTKMARTPRSLRANRAVRREAASSAPPDGGPGHQREGRRLPRSA
jgi:hypothetical protein